MDTREITIDIDTAGAVKVATKGYRGKACKDATKELEKKLGEVTLDIDTDEAKQIETKQNECNRAKH